MKQLIESITNKDHTASNELFEQHMNQLMNQKLDEVKKMIAARIDEQITVNKDGKVHTAAGEEILPSVYRARRQLAEGKSSKKVQRGDKPSVVEAKKEKPIDPRTGKPFKYKPERIRPEVKKKEEYLDDAPPYTEEDRKRDVAAALRQIPKNPPPPLSDHERQVQNALRQIPAHYYKYREEKK